MDAPAGFSRNARYQTASAEDRLWPRLNWPFLTEAPEAAAGRDGAEARAEPRRPVRIAGHVELERDGVQDCLVIDLSPGGALLQVERAAAVGETIKLRLTENGEFAGTVRWRGTGRMGVKFDHFGGLLPS